MTLIAYLLTLPLLLNRFGGIKEELNRRDGRSDGYLEHIFKHAAKELFNTEVKELTYKILK